jgi:hypothetical protein
MSSLGPLSFALSERTDSAPITDGFSDVLNCLVRGDTYRARPPVGPPEDLPALNNDELDALRAESNLADFSDSEQYNYSSLSLFEGDARSKEVPYPSNSLLSDLNICGIDGSNQRVARTSFYFILTRASIVEFKYSSKNAKPYFYDRCEEASAVTLVDGNIFDGAVRLCTAATPESDGERFNTLKQVRQRSRRPLLVRYDSRTNEKSPAQHAMGWAVKIQQALEMFCLEAIRTDQRTVCIKDGPLFSTSLGTKENIDGLQVIHKWRNQQLIASSKRVQDSRLLIELLLSKPDLREYWFPGQNLTEDTYYRPHPEALEWHRKEVFDKFVL